LEVGVALTGVEDGGTTATSGVRARRHQSTARRFAASNSAKCGKPHAGETVGTHLHDGVLDGEADMDIVENSQVTCPDELADDGSSEFLHKSAKSKHRHFCYLLCLSRWISDWFFSFPDVDGGGSR
jgi:hypothetical protein